MPATLIPLVSNICDQFTWKVTAEIASNVVGANKQTAQIKILADSFFCLMAFRGSTNYDNFSGDLRATIGAGPAAAVRLGTPPRVPSNFEVFIRRADVNLTGAPVPQAVISSNGYFAGAQVPFPVLYQPSSIIYFEFFNTAPTLLNTAQAVAIPLRINFGLFGYNVPVENLRSFLGCYPELRASMHRAYEAGELPAQRLTSQAIPGLAQ